jgi:hypothetical protein
VQRDVASLAAGEADKLSVGLDCARVLGLGSLVDGERIGQDQHARFGLEAGFEDVLTGGSACSV